MNSTIISALQSLCCGSVPGSLDKGQISSTPETNAAEAAVKAAFVDAQTTDGDLLLMDLESAYEDINMMGDGLRDALDPKIRD